MPLTDPIPLDLRHATLHVEADDYTMSVDQVRFTPRPEFVWFTPLMGPPTGGEEPHLVSTKWFVSIGFVQDFTDPASLALYLVTHAGQEKVITFQTPGRTIAATVLILPAQLGGQVNTIPAAVVTMPVYGAPDFGTTP